MQQCCVNKILYYLCMVIYKHIDMKKLTIAGVLILLVLQLSAQVRFGLGAGVIYSGWNVEVDGVSDNQYEGMFGFQAGLITEMGLGSHLAFRPELNFVFKGTSVEHGDHHDAIEVMAVDIPLQLLFRGQLGNGRIFAGLGPNIGMNLEAHIHEDDHHHGNGHGHDHDKIVIGNDPGNLKRLDLGLRVLAGYDLGKRFTVSAFYTWGLNDLAPEEVLTIRSGYGGLAVGFFVL